MDLLISVFNTILYQPLFNALVLLYQYLPGQDFGIAVIVLTCLIRLIFYPLMSQSIKSQKKQIELQPKIQEIQKKYKTDPQKQLKEMISLYKKEKINPLAGFLPLLIQLPILIALFKVFMAFKDGLDPSSLNSLYSFIPQPTQINPTFLGMIDLSKSFVEKIKNSEVIIYHWQNLFLALFAAFCQFFQTKMISPCQKISEIKKQDQIVRFSNLIQKQMLYFFPVLTVFILLNLPSAIGLYWIIITLFSIGQQYLVFRK